MAKNSAHSFRTLSEWLPWLETLSPREIVLGLDRVDAVLERLNLSQPQYVVVIGGTNGKGSSAAMLQAILLETGLRTGCYTSPHLRRYNERIQIDAAPAGDAEIVAAMHRVEAVRGDIPLTYFEFGTLAALVCFHRAAVDAWVLEVGLGGRLDAVNAVEPDVSLITNVTLDHCAWLGDDVETIAREKAGIMRRDRPAVFGAELVPDAIREAAEITGAELILADRDFTFANDRGNAATWSWQGRRHSLDSLRVPPLTGAIQIRNAAAVLASVEALGLNAAIDSDVVNKAFASVELAGRFQHVQRDCLWVLDVAHNPAAAREQASRLDELPRAGQMVALIGLFKDKDIDAVITPIAMHIDRWIAVPIEHPRGMNVDALAREIANKTGRPCQIAPDLHSALENIDKLASGDDVVLVTGSFQVVGPALAWLEETPLHAAT